MFIGKKLLSCSRSNAPTGTRKIKAGHIPCACELGAFLRARLGARYTTYIQFSILKHRCVDLPRRSNFSWTTPVLHGCL